VNNTPPIAWTKIIQPMVFIKYLDVGIIFLLGFGEVLKDMLWSPM